MAGSIGMEGGREYKGWRVRGSIGMEGEREYRDGAIMEGGSHEL